MNHHTIKNFKQILMKYLKKKKKIQNFKTKTSQEHDSNSNNSTEI